MIKWFLRAVAAGCVSGLCWAAYTVTSHILKTSPVFTVKTVEVRGVSHTDLERLKKVYQPYVGKNIFTDIVPGSLMTEDPWVIRIEMKRSVPDKLVVIVWEEQEMLTYKSAGKCYTRTSSGNDIAVACNGVKVEIAEAGAEEFNSFVRLYQENDVLRNNEVILKNGFFWVKEEGVVLVGNFMPDVFALNYKAYANKIKPGYRAVEKVDLTVRGKVYVKGVLNG